jgi:hypothetical protein
MTIEKPRHYFVGVEASRCDEVDCGEPEWSGVHHPVHELRRDPGPDWAARRQQAYASAPFSRTELVVIAFAFVAVAIVVIASRGA